MRTLVFTLALLLGCAVGADERILSYDSEIRVRTDSSLEVTETIAVRAEGQQIRHGIFREFPTTYSRVDASRVTVGFDVLSIKRDGVSEPYRTERRSNGIAIYIGDKDRFLSPGEYRYEIRYRTDRQLGFFPDHDELYWNVTGTGGRSQSMWRQRAFGCLQGLLQTRCMSRDTPVRWAQGAGAMPHA